MKKSKLKPGSKVFFVGLNIGFLGFVGFVLLLVEKVVTGHELDYYFTGWGVRFNYLGALVLIAVVPVALVAAWAIRYWHQREEKDFLRRYGKSKSDTDA